MNIVHSQRQPGVGAGMAGQQAEDAIETALDVRPIGFRAPGYSVSPRLLAALARRGYQYDASSLPTFLGPLARSYYFFTTRLTPAQRAERGELFGTWSAGFEPLKPYWCEIDERAGETPTPRRLLEIPVTTLPVLRTPFHSYEK